jgi:hypothetical protein
MLCYLDNFGFYMYTSTHNLFYVKTARQAMCKREVLEIAQMVARVLD